MNDDDEMTHQKKGQKMITFFKVIVPFSKIN